VVAKPSKDQNNSGSVDTFSSRLARESVLNESNFGGKPASTSGSANPVAAKAQRASKLKFWHYLMLAAVLLFFLGGGWLGYKALFQKPVNSVDANKYQTTPLDVNSLKPAASTVTTNQVIVNGDVIANNFSGNGTNLDNLNATNLRIGTVNDARLSNNVALKNGNNAFTGANTFGGASTFSGVVSLPTTVSFAGQQYSFPGSQATGFLKNDGSGNLVWSAGGAGGCAGQCPQNGGDSFGSAISIGTNDLFGLSLRTNGVDRLTISQTGAVSIGGGVVAASFAGDGSNLTGLSATQITNGTLSNARLSASVTTQGNTFNGIDQLVLLNSLGYMPALNGGNLTSLNASNVTSGNLLDARLSANVALLDSNQTFTGNKTFSTPILANTITPSGAMTVGATNQNLTLQGNGNAKITSTNAGGSVSVGFTGVSTGAVVYQFDAAAAPGTYTICTTGGGACGGGGGSVSSAGGTTNRLAKFTGSQAINDSSITDTGTAVSIGAAQLRVNGAAGGYAIDATGDINASQYLRVGGNIVCDSTGCLSSGGGGAGIQNTTVQQSAANFFIQSAGVANPTGIIKALGSQTADLLQFQNSVGATIAEVYASGSINTIGAYYVGGVQIASANLSDSSNLAKLGADQTFTGNDIFGGNFISRRSADSTTAFRVQKASSANVLVVDTSNGRVAIGADTAAYPLDVTGDINSSTGLRVGGTLVCDSTGCASSGSSGFYIQNGVAQQPNANFYIQTANANNVVGILQGKASQVADMFQILDSTGASLFKVNNVGLTTINNGLTFTGGNQTVQNNTGGLNLVSNSSTLAVNNTTTFTSGDSTGIRYAADYTYQPLSLVSRNYVDNAISGVVAGTCPTCFLNGGNSFGSTASIGTNDNNILNIETANTTRIKLGTDASIAFSGSTASGSYAVSMGSGTASGLASFAGGETTTAAGQDSFAFGYQTQVTAGLAAVAFGRQNTVSANYAAGFGIGTTVSGEGAFGIGGSTASGGYSFSGYNGIASGLGSFTFGNNTHAYGTYSVAFGNTTKANETVGVEGFAWGRNTVANHNFATAWGEGSSATGQGSTASGYYSVASGISSFASGFSTASNDNAFAINHSTASGVNSFSAGNSTRAYGTYSVAFGNSTKANETVGVEGFAWGRSTVANHNFATAWGEGSSATGQGSTASGYYSVASGLSSFAAGNSTASNDNAFAVNHGTASGANSFAAGYSAVASSSGAMAWGLSTQATTNPWTTAWGENTVATGQDSTATGYFSTASGYYSFAANNSVASNTGAFSVNHGTASGVVSFAAGEGTTTASGQGSAAFGANNVASSRGGMTWGLNNQAKTNDWTTAWGESTTASGGRSTAFGYGTQALGTNDVAWGRATVADSTLTGESATAWGYTSHAIANISTAFGNNSLASSVGSTAWGVNTQATTNPYATAWGENTTATGQDSTASGYFSTASGLYSFAANNSVASNTSAFSINHGTASGVLAFAAGEGTTTASGQGSAAFGANNVASSRGGMAWGLNTQAKTNDWTTAWGEGSVASGGRSTAFGYNTQALGVNDTAWGRATVADSSLTGESATAWGYNTRATGNVSTAFGYNSIASGNGATAFGVNMTVSGLYSVGIGLDTTVQTISQANTMAIMNGSVGIGTVAPTVSFEVSNLGTTSVSKFDGSGSTQCTVVTGTGWSCSSDERLKTNVVSIDGGLDKIMQLRGVTFNWLSNPNGVQQNGFIAQEVQKIFPELVSTDSNGYLSLNKDGLMAYMVRGAQEQQGQINTLRNQVNALKTSQPATSIDVLAELSKAKAISFNGDVTINGKLAITGTLELKGDNKGTITLPAGQTKAHLTFKKNFGEAPNVTATPKNLSKASFAIENETVDGFDIVIDTAQAQDLQFNYQAF
jgi:trimeric autotransporter adhesin